MPDLLVKLYELPPLEGEIERMKQQSITIRRVLPPEKHVVLQWVGEHFGRGWVSECDSAFHQSPPSCWIAVEDEKMIGFGCYDATMKGFFGPTGVSEMARGRGVGRALLIACLHAMSGVGYGYAIIGGAGPVEFYQKTVGAVVIENSYPGIYKGLLS
jgi:GNAT superfamily N-acetyltransferase